MNHVSILVEVSLINPLGLPPQKKTHITIIPEWLKCVLTVVTKQFKGICHITF